MSEPAKEPANNSPAMNDNDIDAPYKDAVFRAAKSLLENWAEFGPDGGLDDYIETLRAALSRT